MVDGDMPLPLSSRGNGASAATHVINIEISSESGVFSSSQNITCDVLVNFVA